MTVFEGIILGLVQGVAEFLPISSSGHLMICQHFFALTDVPLLFDVFLHLATLASVILYFRKKIWRLLLSFARIFSKKNDEEEIPPQEIENRRMILGVVLATIVTGIIGVCVSKFLDGLSINFVFAGLIFTGLVLIASNFVKKSDEIKSPSWWQSLLIGLAQGIGTLPGVSRSGSTISGALFCGVNQEAAGEFSFIASIPAILGAFILELKDLGEVSSSVGAAPVIAGCAASFASGFIALTYLMKMIKKGRLWFFAFYLIPAGIIGLFCN